MLSNAIDVGAYAALTYGAYVFGGRGAAAFVAGGALLLVSYTVSGRKVEVRLPRLRRVHREARRTTEVTVPDPVFTNADFEQWRRERAEAAQSHLGE